MGVVDGTGGDNNPILNVKSTRRNQDGDVEPSTPVSSHSVEDPDANQDRKSTMHQQQEQMAFGHSGLGRLMDSSFHKDAVMGGQILRSHRDQRKVQERHEQGLAVENDGGQGLGRSVAQQSNGGVGGGRNGEVEGKGFKRDIRELEELLSKLNPMAEEFVPPVLTNRYRSDGVDSAGFMYSNDFGFQHQMMSNGNGNINGNGNGGRRRNNNFSNGKRMNNRTSMAQREEIIRRTVYVSEIDQQITEEHLAALFINCGQVVDCRICGDPNSVLRFAFVEFTDEEGARAALGLSGTMLGFYPVKVLPSKTAIAPVNPTFLPRSEDEREMCARTIYCTNIDKRVSQADIKLFFESVCGEVYRLRLLGDSNHATRIAFVEFVLAQSAIAALNCSGVVIGSLPIRISPSKTPVRPRALRPLMN